jgi:SAM-dependent methyltransferase
MAAADLLTTTSFGEAYYHQHKEAGLDYLAHGEWQITYGRWFVEALGLRGRTLLDVGCACGSIAAGLAKAGALVSGCDANEHMIRLGRERWLANQLFVCDATNLHYWRDRTFNTIHSAQVFEHFKPDLVPHILDELWRVTQDGGILFAALDTVEMYARQVRNLAREDATHICVKPMAWWHQQLASAGWALAPDLLERLRLHPESYFAHYDWDAFCCRKTTCSNRSGRSATCS